MKQNMRIDDVPMDDVPAALAFAKQSMADGTWDSDVAESLLNRQRDPHALLTALGAQESRRAR